MPTLQVTLEQSHYQRARTGKAAAGWPHVPEEAFAALGVSREGLRSFDQQLLGDLVLPGMPGYASACRGDDLCRYSARPQLVVNCRGPGDVGHTLEWARRHDWRVACRSGGHSTAGFSTTDGVVIDLSGIRYVSVDRARKLARVGAGTRFDELNSVLDLNRLHVPGGACGEVGIGGFVQGGGYGFTSRMFGLNCDSMVEATVMLADGRLVTANHARNPDLLWALRGGTGGNFGVLLEVCYRLQALDDLWGFGLIWQAAEAPDALAELQASFMKDDPPQRLGYVALLQFVEGRPVLVMAGMYDGTRAEGLAALAPLRSIGKPVLNFDLVATYGHLNAHLLDLLPGLPPPPGGAYESKDSQLITERLDREAWSEVVSYFETSPHAYNLAVVEPYGGQVGAVGPEESAFVHRDAYGEIYIDSFWKKRGGFTREREADAWLRGFMDLLRPFGDGRKYQNYPIRGEPDYRWAYWADAFNSLLFVKQKYDPENFFSFEQSISPYPDDPAIRRSQAPSRFSDMTVE